MVRFSKLVGPAAGFHHLGSRLYDRERASDDTPLLNLSKVQNATQKRTRLDLMESFWYEHATRRRRKGDLTSFWISHEPKPINNLLQNLSEVAVAAFVMEP